MPGLIGRFSSIVGLTEVEARASLDAVLEDVDQEPEEVRIG